ncbi:MAG: UbiA family prenyltransferase, partial [Ignavibacteriales bacterium]|nr:UbiA family prenyltransferase [Ignavibacteriales bacterium]
MMNYIKGIFLISRPINFLLTFAVIFIACLICAINGLNYFTVTLASLSGAIIASAGNIINDYYDFEIDKINRPKRVLPQKLLSKSFALILFFVFCAISIFITALLNLYATIIAVVTILLLFLYSLYFKRVILIGNIIVALCTGLAFIYGGVVVDNWTYALI